VFAFPGSLRNVLKIAVVATAAERRPAFAGAMAS
jgi:hypothetical protein